MPSKQPKLIYVSFHGKNPKEHHNKGGSVDNRGHRRQHGKAKNTKADWKEQCAVYQPNETCLKQSYWCYISEPLVSKKYNFRDVFWWCTFESCVIAEAPVWVTEHVWNSCNHCFGSSCSLWLYWSLLFPPLLQAYTESFIPFLNRVLVTSLPLAHQPGDGLARSANTHPGTTEDATLWLIHRFKNSRVEVAHQDNIPGHTLTPFF